jgi:predicted acyl esterase
MSQRRANSMFTTSWQTSPRKYSISVQRGVSIPLGDGIELLADVYRPDAPGKFPALLAASPYSKEAQAAAVLPVGFTYPRAWLESGDYNFYVRRGYAFIIATIRGARGSGGFFGNIEPDPRTVQDMYDAIGWLAQQSWCDGNVGMVGASYFSLLAKRVATLKPPALKAIFSPYGFSDGYRDFYYHGGILSVEFVEFWLRRQSPFLRTENPLRNQWGQETYAAASKKALSDPEISTNPLLVTALRNPDAGANAVLNEILLQPFDGPYYRERAVDFSRKPEVPGYFGADWGLYGIHLRGDLCAYSGWAGPKRVSIGPPIYLDRPLYQYADESLRWFDHWLKGIDTGMLEEPPVQVFIEGRGEWKTGSTWPFPDTRWTSFYLHEKGLLSEHEHWPQEGFTAYEDSMFGHGEVRFRTSPMVEVTELCGPVVLNLYGSTTDTEVLWFITLFHENALGHERLLTRGWLRGSQRRLDAVRSKPWQPYHTHDKREPLKPDEIYEFNIEVNPIGLLLKPGERLGLRIKSADDESAGSTIEHTAMGHVRRGIASRVCVHHNAEYPSELLLPITQGNRIGTFISGGVLPPLVPLV